MQCISRDDKGQTLTGHAITTHDNLQGFVEPSVDAGATLNVILDYAAAVKANGGDLLSGTRRRLVETNDEQRTVYNADALTCQT
jgi:hypothetical protein